MPLTELRDFYIDVLKDIYNAEKQLTRSLPRMAKAARSPELRDAFQHHLRTTEEQIRRLEEVFQGLDMKPTGKTCRGMKGIIEEGQETLREAKQPVLDAALIASAQKVEHYEICSYGTARTFAEMLGEDDAVRLLEETLEEEKRTDQNLSKLADSINQQAQPGMEHEAERGREARSSRSSRSSGSSRSNRSASPSSSRTSSSSSRSSSSRSRSRSRGPGRHMNP